MRISRVSLEKRKRKLLAEISKVMPLEAEQLRHTLSMIEIESDREFCAANHKAISANHTWDSREYPKPRHVIFAILKEHGGRAKRTDIAKEAVEGGWRMGGKAPYYDILAGIEYLLGKYRPRRNAPLRELEDGTIELTESTQSTDRHPRRAGTPRSLPKGGG